MDVIAKLSQEHSVNAREQADQGSLPAHTGPGIRHHSPLSLSVSHSPLWSASRVAAVAVGDADGVVSSSTGLARPGGRLKTEKECGS